MLNYEGHSVRLRGGDNLPKTFSIVSIFIIIAREEKLKNRKTRNVFGRGK